MGSVTRRIRRNTIAANLASKAGIRMPPVRARNADGSTFLLHSKYLSPTHYRTTMLRVYRAMIQRRKAEHDLHQKQQGRKGRLTSFFGGWKKSWLRRFFEGVMPSLFGEIRAEQKAERERKRKERSGTPNQAERHAQKRVRTGGLR